MLDAVFKPKAKAGADPDARLEILTADDWRALLQHPLSVLIFTRSQCPWCTQWHQELAAFLGQGGADWTRGIRFGMLALDQPGLAEFKMSNPWIKDTVKLVPYNVIYVCGERKAEFPGAELRRLANTFRRLSKLHLMKSSPCD